MQVKADEYEEIDFVVEKESWNVYAVEDGAIIRLKTVLIKAMKLLTIKDPTRELGGETQNIITVKVPRGYKYLSTPSNKLYTPQELLEASATDLRYEVLTEDWNLYRLADDSQLKLKTVVSRIRRTHDKFDRYGIPMYVVDSSTVVNVSAPKK